jgi:hypothetical protein
VGHKYGSKISGTQVSHKPPGYLNELEEHNLGGRMPLGETGKMVD